MGIIGRSKKEKDNKKLATPTKKDLKEFKEEKGATKLKTETVKKQADKKLETTPTMADLYATEATKKTKGAGASSAKIQTAFTDAYKVLLYPLITEKAATASSLNKYVFVVSKEANKLSVAKAVFAVYGVKPIRVNIVCQSGKTVTRGRIKGRRSDLKKAIVTLKKGDSIQVYEGV